MPTHAFRRRMLMSVGGAFAGTTGCMPFRNEAPDEPMDPMPHENGETIDLVDDAGADPTGDDLINEALSAAIADGVRVLFPEGEYWIADDGYEDPEVANLSLMGEGDVSLRPTPATNPLLLRFDAENLRIANLTIDQTADETSTGMSVLASDRLVIRDVRFTGAGDGRGDRQTKSAITGHAMARSTSSPV